MNTIACMSKVLERITENMDSFECNENITKMINSVCKIGSYTVKNLLPCTLLENVLKILKKFKPVSQSHSYQVTKFLNEVDEFYHKETLCNFYKIVILANHPPAVEFEVLKLLKLCLDIKACQEIDLLKAAIFNSNLPRVSSKNPEVYLKVNAIFKQSFVISEGNPVVAYLSSAFVKAVNDTGVPNCQMFSEHFQHIETMLSIPLEICSKRLQLHFLEQLVHILAETLKFKFCETEDVLFLSALYPAHYYHMLKYLSESDTDYIPCYFKIVGKFLAYDEIKEKQGHVASILNNPMWKLLL